MHYNRGLAEILRDSFGDKRMSIHQMLADTSPHQDEQKQILDYEDHQELYLEKILHKNARFHF